MEIITSKVFESKAPIMKSIQALLLLVAATASAVKVQDDGGRYDGKDGPSPPDTNKLCTYWYTTDEPMETCDYIEQETNISHKDFVAWNPSLKEDCSGINVGWAYCIEVNHGRPVPTSADSKPPASSPAATSKPASKPAPADGPSTTSAPPSPTKTPSPIQEGIVQGCTGWYKANAGDSCDAITKKGGFTLKQFVTWNPAVGEDCSGLWAHFYYCTSVPGFTPSMTTSTTRPAPRSPSSDASHPTKTQEGIIDTCNKWVQAKGGDTCDGIAKRYGLSSKDFKEWNPAVQDDCSGLWANYYYCVSIPGHGSGPAAPPPPPPKPSAPKQFGPRTQDGMVANCQTIYTAKAGDTCSSIVSQFNNLDLATFIQWNPAVGADCYNLWANYGYCVGTKDRPASGHDVAPPPFGTSPSGCSKPHPEPTQPGSLCECKQWYKVSQGDGCWSIANKFGVTEDDLRRWNPDSNCELWLNYNVCVSA